MAKANMVLRDGTKVTIEGTAEEVGSLLARCSGGGANGRKSGKKGAAKPAGKPKKNKSGPTQLITELAAENFFKTKRGLGDIQKKLEERGHIYAITTISPVSTRLTRQRVLRRLKEKNKGWVYVT